MHDLVTAEVNQERLIGDRHSIAGHAAGRIRDNNPVRADRIDGQRLTV
jgi:hypothetical protein